MTGEHFFVQTALYLAAAVVAVPIATRLGLGSVLGYLLAGIAIGPFGLGLVGEEGQDVMHFAEFGVVMMLFVVGLELRPQLLWRMRFPVLGLGGAQVLITAAILFGIASAVGLPWRVAIAVGLALALSSTAIVLQSLNEKGLMKTDAGQSSFAVLLFQDIAVIPMLALFPLLAAPGGGGGGASGDAGDGHGPSETWLDSLDLSAGAETLVVLGAIVVVIVGGQLLARPFLRFVASTRLRELFTAAALLLVVAIALLMTKVGLSPALGTFLAGVVLANSEYRHELESDLEPFKGLLLGVFFIAVGASIDFALVAAQPLNIAMLVVGLIVVKLAVLFALGRVFRMGLDQNLIFAFSLAQGGEFAFVLFSFATQSGVMTHAEAAPLVAAVALTMALTPVLMIVNERLILPRFGTRTTDDAPHDDIDESGTVIVAGFGDFGGTVVRFLRANGVTPVVLDSNSERIELLRRLGLTAYYGDARRRELLHAAGAEEARVLIVAIGDILQTKAILHTVHSHFPHLEVFVRAPAWFEAAELVKSGQKRVYRQNAESALRVARETLRFLGHRGHQLHRAALRFSRHDDDAMVELAENWGDDSAYVTAARERIANLERLMLAEKEDDVVDDAGWDVDTLRREFGQRRDT